MLFLLGDALFLTLIGALSALAMSAVDRLEWNALLLSLLGMALAMAVQMALALLIAPLLGSIESMAPSMVVAMAVPMILEGLDMLGVELVETHPLSLGAAWGFVAFALLRLYGAACRRRFRRTYGAP